MKRWNNLQSNTIAFLNLRKHTGVVFKHGDQAVVITDLSDTDKTYKYSVQPYLDSSQVNHTHIVNPKSDIQLPFLSKRTNLIQFNSRLLLVLDRKLRPTVLPEKINLDYLVISENPETAINFINKYYNYGLLIIDNTNPNKLITNIKADAKALPVNYKVLYRNKSLIISSN